MTHGRSHDERLNKAEKPRANNLPADDDTALESDIALRGKGHVKAATIPAARADRAGPGGGSTVAPTRRAEEREHERHEREARLGHVAAGTEGNARPIDTGETGHVAREDLDEAAREADRIVAPPPQH